MTDHHQRAPWLMLAVGLCVGRTSGGAAEDNALEQFEYLVEHALIPLYIVGVLAYLSSLFFRTYLAPTLMERRLLKATNLDDDEFEDVMLMMKESEQDAVVSSEGGADQQQPINLTGKYKLTRVSNFDAFLKIQGVPWALRQAACKARPVHRIIHRGNKITIRIEGLITTQTTYRIDGPPEELNIRGRIFQDRIVYLGDKGVRSIKEAVNDNYDIHIDRILSDDKKIITLTGKAIFRDERETIESEQIFERIG